MELLAHIGNTPGATLCIGNNMKTTALFFLTAISFALASVPRLAHADLRATNIVQVDSPRLYHLDGRPYTAQELGMSFVYRSMVTAGNNNWDQSYDATVQTSHCDGRDCPSRPLGFLPGATLPDDGNFARGEADLAGMVDLTQPGAHQYIRSDLFIETPGTALFSDSRRANSWTLLALQFVPTTTEPITVSFTSQRYMHVAIDAGTPPAGFITTQSVVTVGLYDWHTGTGEFFLNPAELNFSIGFSGGGPAQVYHEELAPQEYSITSGSLNPLHRYYLEFRQESLTRGVMAVPEPSAFMMLLAAFAVFSMVRLRRRVASSAPAS